MAAAYTPQQTFELVSRAGAHKGNVRLDKVFLSATMAGMLLSFACATLVTCNSAPWFQKNAPGLIRVIAALVFPYGLSMVILSGTELSTGSFMYTTVAAIHGRLRPDKMLIHWIVTFFGNLAGSLFVVAVITGYGGTFNTGVYHDEVKSFAETKQLVPWHFVLLRGIGANWLVCMACFLGLSGRDFASKVIGIWFPTFAFVSLGFDHVVANMFFVPAGIFQGANITVGRYIGSGMVPACIGNIIGGAFFVGTWYWYLHLFQEPAVLIDGAEYMPRLVAADSFDDGSGKKKFGGFAAPWARKRASDEEAVTPPEPANGTHKDA